MAKPSTCRRGPGGETPRVRMARARWRAGRGWSSPTAAGRKPAAAPAAGAWAIVLEPAELTLDRSALVIHALIPVRLAPRFTRACTPPWGSATWMRPASCRPGAGLRSGTARHPAGQHRTYHRAYLPDGGTRRGDRRHSSPRRALFPGLRGSGRLSQAARESANMQQARRRKPALHASAIPGWRNRPREQPSAATTSRPKVPAARLISTSV